VLKGLALAVPVLFMSSTSYITGLVIKKKLKLMKWFVVTGLALIAVSLALLGIFDKNTYLFFAFISVAGIGTGLTLPCLNTIITSSCEAQKRGLVTSLYGSVRFFGVALGPPLFSILVAMGWGIMFWSAAGLAGVAALLSLLLIKVRDMKEPVTTGKENKKGQKGKDASPTSLPIPARKPDIANK